MRRRATLGVVLAAFALTMPCARAQSDTAPQLAGLTLAEALERLRSVGLAVVYSSELVRPEMRVAREPAGLTLRQVVEQLLAPHGLAVAEGPNGALLVIAAAHPSGGTIRGVIRAQDTGQAFPFILVRLSESGASVRSGADGGFRFEGLREGSYTVIAGAPGYVENAVEGITISPGSEVEVAVALVPQPRFLQDVVVTPSRFGFLHRQPGSRQFLDRDEVQRLPHLSEDVFRVVHRLPGTAAGDISADFGVRGSTPDEVAVLVDGLQVFDPFHLRGFYRLFSIIDSEMVDGVELLTGGFPVEHGDRMSGVVDITSSVPRESLRAVGISGFNARALIQGARPDDGSSWLVSVRRGYLDWLNRWLGTIDQSAAVEARPTFGDLFATVRHQVGARGFLSAHLLASFDDHDVVDAEDRERSEGTTTNWFAWANLFQDFPGGLSGRTTVSVIHASQRTVGSSDDGAPSATDLLDERTFDIAALKQDWILEPWRSHLLKWGFEVRRVEGSYDRDARFVIRDPLLAGPEAPLLVEQHSHVKPGGWQYVLYTADRFRLTPGVTVEAGVRWDRQTWTPGDDQLSPRLNLVWETEQLGTFRAAWGRFAQSQAIYELQVADGVDAFYPAQFAEHRIVTWDRTLPSGFELRAEAYRKVMTDLRPRFENLIDSLDLFPEGEGDRVRIAPERAEARGLELVVKSPERGRWSWWTALAFAEVDDLIDGRWVPRSWDQRRALSFSINWRPGRRWNLNLAGTYHSGWPVTPTSTYFDERPDGTLELVSQIGSRNSERLPSYHRFDLRVSRTVPLRRSMLRLFLEVMNLTDHENPRVADRASFQSDGVSYWVSWDDESWIPILLTLGFTWEF